MCVLGNQNAVAVQAELSNACGSWIEEISYVGRRSSASSLGNVFWEDADFAA
jgi:hypothetical protein